LVTKLWDAGKDTIKNKIAEKSHFWGGKVLNPIIDKIDNFARNVE